jgi:hypothetical protein
MAPPGRRHRRVELDADVPRKDQGRWSAMVGSAGDLWACPTTTVTGVIASDTGGGPVAFTTVEAGRPEAAQIVCLPNRAALRLASTLRHV